MHTHDTAPQGSITIHNADKLHVITITPQGMMIPGPGLSRDEATQEMVGVLKKQVDEYIAAKEKEGALRPANSAKGNLEILTAVQKYTSETQRVLLDVGLFSEPDISKVHEMHTHLAAIAAIASEMRKVNYELFMAHRAKKQ